MKIHSDVLTLQDLHRAITLAGLTDVWVEDLAVVGSRSRQRAYEVRLAAKKAKGRRPRNTGRYGASGQYEPVSAATYDEHGRWMARLFDVDPDAIVGPYKGVDDFRDQTKEAYL